MAKRVALQKTWEVMGTQVLVSLMEEGDSDDTDQEDFDPNKTVIINGIPGEITDKHLFDILCLATGVDEGKFTVQRRGSRALFRLVGKYKQGMYKYMYPDAWAFSINYKSADRSTFAVYWGKCDVPQFL